MFKQKESAREKIHGRFCLDLVFRIKLMHSYRISHWLFSQCWKAR